MQRGHMPSFYPDIILMRLGVTPCKSGSEKISLRRPQEPVEPGTASCPYGAGIQANMSPFSAPILWKRERHVGSNPVPGPASIREKRTPRAGVPNIPFSLMVVECVLICVPLLPSFFGASLWHVHVNSGPMPFSRNVYTPQAERRAGNTRLRVSNKAI
eukprot:1145401-Pelagomonas_calceolata.AAC.4